MPHPIVTARALHRKALARICLLLLGIALRANVLADVSEPDAPTALTAVAGDAQAKVFFSPPVNDGGSAITSYTATSTPGNFTATGSASPLTVTGLTNGANYTFTVVATNVIGDSVASATSNSVTPYSTPSLAGGGGSPTAQNTNSPVIVDAAITVSGTSPITGALILIDNRVAGDVLAFDAAALPVGVTGAYNASTGTLTFTGTASAAEWQALLRTVTFAAPWNTTLGTRNITFSLGTASIFWVNGHYYEFVPAPSITWTAAKAAAETRSFYGMQGYLTTVTSAGENAFIGTKLAGQGWMGGSDAAQESIWRWVTGPEGLEDSGKGRHILTQTRSNNGSPSFASVYSSQGGGGGTVIAGHYNNWADSEPNDAHSLGENHAHFYPSAQWNDYPDDAGNRIVGYVVEYGGMAGDPALTVAAATTLTVIDTTAPVVSSVSVPASKTYVAGENLSFTVAFNEGVTVNTGGGTPSLPLTLNTGGSVSAAYYSGSGTQNLVFRYTVATGNLDLDGIAIGSALVANGATLRDAAGNNATLTLNNVASTADVKIDAIAPQVSSILRKTPAAGATTASAVVYEVTFSEAVQNMEARMFTVTPLNGSTIVGAVTAISGGPSVYDVTVTISSGEGDFRLDLTSIDTTRLSTTAPATSYGSGLYAQSIAVDNTGTLYVPDYSSDNIYKVTAAAATPTLFASTGYTYITGTAFDGTGNLYMVSTSYQDLIKVTPSGTVTVLASGLNYPQDIVCDATGNLYVTDTSNDQVLKVTPAGVVSTFVSDIGYPVGIAIDPNGNLIVSNGYSDLIKVTPAGVTSTFAAGVGYAHGLTCDAAGNVYMADQNTGSIVRVSADGTTSTHVSNPGLGFPYDVAIDAAGRLFVADAAWGTTMIIDVAKLDDTAGNHLVGIPYTSGQLYTKTAGITGVSSASADGTYGIGATINVAVSFDAPVTVDTTGGTPKLHLKTGATDREAIYVTGTGTDTLTFNYTVQNGDLSADLDYVSTAALALNSGTIRNSLNDDAILTLPAPGAAGSLGANKNLVIDGIRPTASIVVADPNVTIGETSLVTITFSEAISGFDNSDLTVANGTLSAVSSSNGGITWTTTFTPAANIEDATNVLTLDNTGVTDAVGNTGTGTTNSNNYAIDTKRPTATVVVADSSLTLGETSLVTISFSEAVSGFTSADLTASNGSLSTVSSSDGGVTWTTTFTPTASTEAATNIITLHNTGVTDAAGNAGTGTTDSNNYAIDNVVPAAPSAPDLAAASDSGSSHSDNLTRVTTPVFAGTAEANSTVELFRGGATSLGTTTANGSGNWSLTVASALAEGTHSVTARATDSAGNTGPLSTPLEVIIDTTASAAPALAAITDDTGTSATDRITSDTTLLLSGTGIANETITVFRNAAQIGTALVNGSGVWSFDYTGTTLAAGTHTFTATTTDIAGNTSAGSATFVVEIDTETPAAPAIVAIASDTGISPTDGITNVNTLVLAGVADPLVTVTLSRNGAGIIGATTSNADGAWSFDHSASALVEGTHVFTAFASDTAGNNSAASADFAVTIDTAAPAITTQPVGGSPDAKTSFTLAVAATDATALTYRWHFNGIALSDSPQHSGSATASLTISDIDPAGFSGNYTVVITDAAGNSTTSEPATIVVNKIEQTIAFGAIGAKSRTAPSFDLSATATSSLPVVFTVVSGPATITGNTVTLTGTPGLVTIAANQPGDTIYVAAPAVTQAFTVLADFPEPQADGYAQHATGGSRTGISVVVNTTADFRLHAGSATPAIITVVGILDLDTTPVAINSDKTIQGVDAGATLIGNLFIGPGVRNVVIQGLNLTNPGVAAASLPVSSGLIMAAAPAARGDALTIAGARVVFVTRCTFFDTADHAIQVIDGADEVTLSWNEFYYTTAHTGQRHSVLVGNSSSDFAAPRVSIHHNRWSAGVDGHIPLVHQGRVHFYNNVIASTGNAAATEAGPRAELFSERNLYQGVNAPLAASSGNQQGRVFSHENTYTGTTGAAPYAGNDTVFTPAYSYEALPVSDLAVVLDAAGNQGGGGYAQPVTATARINGPDTPIVLLEGFTLTAVSNGITPVAWQWRLNNQPIPGATNLAYPVARAEAKDAGNYTVALSLASGDVVVSSPLEITVNAQAEPKKLAMGHSGGGAPSIWFLTAIATLALLRRTVRRPRG